MTNEDYIKRCIHLAKKGFGNASPNPLVGSVIVHNNEIIGEGFHQKFGEAHAEVNAINSVKDKSLLAFSTIYINLEPCAHFGKTPPCADLIIKSKIPNVVIGHQDPFSKVNGQGIDKLKAAGCKVIVGVCENECNELNKRFFTLHQQKRPYVILKWAESMDGFIDKNRSENEKGIFWLSHPKTKRLVHQWRAQEDAILVGRKTVDTDDPELTAREWKGSNPIRVILDSKAQISQNRKVLNGAANTLIYNTIKSENIENIQWVKTDKNSLIEILEDLGQRNISSIIVEGGFQVLTNFIQENLWDEARIIKGQSRLISGKKSPIISGEVVDNFEFNGDEIRILKPILK